MQAAKEDLIAVGAKRYTGVSVASCTVVCVIVIVQMCIRDSTISESGVPHLLLYDQFRATAAQPNISTASIVRFLLRFFMFASVSYTHLVSKPAFSSRYLISNVTRQRMSLKGLGQMAIIWRSNHRAS